MNVAQKPGNTFEEQFCESTFTKCDFITQAYKKLQKYKELS